MHGFQEFFCTEISLLFNSMFYKLLKYLCIWFLVCFLSILGGLESLEQEGSQVHLKRLPLQKPVGPCKPR